MALIFLYPVLELLSLILLGREIGAGATFLYLCGSFIVGINLIRSAGLTSVQMASPSTILEAPFRLMAGVLILVPGLISDVLAILILVPFVRRVLWTFAVAKLFKGRVYQSTWTYGNPPNTSAAEDIVDVTYVREERDVTPKTIDDRKP